MVLGACVLGDLTAPPIDPADVDFSISGDTLVLLGGTTPMTAALPGGTGGAIHLKWTSSNVAIATVDSTTGVVTGVSLGNATITARLTAPELDSAGVERTHALRVKYASIAIAPQDSIPGFGLTRNLVANGQNTSGANIAPVTATYALVPPDGGIITLTTGGLVTAKTNGTALVEALFDGLRDTIPVKVRQVAKSITLPVGTFTFQNMQRDTSLTGFTIKDVNDSSIALPPPGGLNWGTANPSIVTISPSTGVMRAVGRNPSSISLTVDTVVKNLPTAVLQVVDHLDPCSANMTADTVALTIATPPCIEAKDAGDAGGVGVPNVQITFLVTGGGGSITPASGLDTTDLNGRASVASWTLGTAAGTNNNSLSVSGGGKNTSVAMSALAGLPADISQFAGDSQSAPVTSPVPIPPAAIVVDQYGNPTPNVTVSFTVTLGGGTIQGGLTTTNRTTNASGVATVSDWTLGSASGLYNNRLTATVQGTGLSYVFTATAGSLPPKQIAPGSCAVTQSATVGSAVAQQPCVVVRDSLDNPVQGAQVTFTVNTGGGNLTGATDTTDASGTASVTSWTLGPVAGTNNNTVSATFTGFSGSPVVFTASGLAGALPLQIGINAGDNQSATVGTAVAVDPQVAVTDVYNNKMLGTSVTFTVLTGGGTVSGAAQLTGSSGPDSGLATVLSWTLGTTAGTQTLRAALTSTPATFVIFTATGIPGTATQILANAGNNQTATVNQVVAIAPAAKVADQYGNGIPGISVTCTVATGGGTVLGGTQTTDANGLATVTSWRLGTAAGANNNTLSCSALSLTPVTFTASANAGVAVSMAINSGDNQTAEVGTAVAVPPKVFVADSFGNGVGSQAVTFAVVLGGGNITGGNATSGPNGIAQVGSWTLGTGAGTNNNTLTATSAGLGGSPRTFTASATAGVAQNIAIQAGNGQTATAGTPVATPPSVLVTDRFGNPKASINVTFGATAGNGTVGGPATVATNGSGIATVGSWTLSTIAGADTLTATSAGLTGSPITFTAAANAGAATQLTLDGGQSQTAAVGTTLPTTYTVKVADANGNGVSSVSVSWNATGGGGSITPSLSTTNAQGIATASRTLGTAAGEDSATATVPALTLTGEPVIFAATANAGAASVIEANSLTSQSDTVGDTTAASPSVLITDQYGNPRSGVSVTFAVTSGGGQILGGATKNTNALGVATVNAWVLGNTAVANTVTATSAGLTGSPLTFTSTGLAGPATTLELNAGDGQSATVNSAVPVKPAVRVVDAFGNAKSGISITFSPQNGSVTSGVQTTNASGIATVGNWTLATAAGTNTLIAWTTSGSISLVNDSLVFTATGNAGGATQITNNSSVSQSATVNSAVGAAPSVLVRDQFNNPVQGVSVTFTLTAGGGSLTGGSPQNGTTNASGIATSGTWTVGTVAGTDNNTVSAASTGLSGSPVGFTASGNAGVAASLTIEAGNNQSVVPSSAVPIAPAVKVTDAFGNPKASVSVTFAPSAGSSVTGSPANTNASGVATVGSWTLGAAGAYTLQASSGGLTPVGFNGTAIAGGANTMAKAAPSNDAQTGVVGTTLPLPYQVLVTNGATPVQGVVVSWTVLTGGGSIPSTSTTDINGIAVATHTLGASQGAQSVRASVGGLTGSPQDFTSTATALPPKFLLVDAGDGQNATVGTAVATAPSVLVTDSLGNAQSGISIQFTVETSGRGGSLNAGLDTVNTTTNSFGIAAVTQWVLDTAAGTNAVKVIAPSNVLTGEPLTFTATGDPGAAFAIALNAGNSQSGTVGLALASPFVVKVSDQYGNGVPGVSVTWAATGGGGSIPSSSVSDVNGLASETLTLGTSPGANTATATVTGLSGSPVGFTATANPAGPDNMIITAGNGQTVTVNTTVPTAPAITVRDQFGNGVPGVSVQFEITEGNGLLDGFATPVVVNTNGSGVASVTSWKLGITAGANTIAVTTGSLPNDTLFIGGTGTADVATTISAASGDGQTGTVGAALPGTYVVQVTDQYGNGVVNVTVTWAVPGGQGSITPSSITNASGLANATRVLGTTPGAQTATGSSAGLGGSPVGFTATANPDDPAALLISAGNGQTAAVGTAVATAPAVQVTDQFGNPISGVDVTFTITGGAGSLNPGPSPSTIQTGGGGVAALTSWTLGTAAGANALDVSSGGLTPVSFNATGTPGAPQTIMLLEGDAQAATVNTAVPTPPAVRVQDQYGNGVQGVQVDFTVTQGFGALISASPISDATGTARVGSWTLGTTAGPNALAANAPAFVLTGEPVPFTATGTPGGAAQIFLFSGDGQGGTVGAPLGAEPIAYVTDQFGNPVPGAEVTFTPYDGGYGIGSVGDPVDTTDQNGYAGAQSWTLSTISGYNYLQAGINGGAQVNYFYAYGNPGAPTTLEPLGIDLQAEQVGNFVPNYTAVRAVDQYGNGVQGFPVTVRTGAGNGLIFGSDTSIVYGTDFNGYVFVSWRLDTLSGPDSIQFIAGGLGGSPVTYTATANPGPPQRLLVVAGNEQGAQVNSQVPVDPVVKVADFYGNGIPGIGVNWFANPFGQCCGFVDNGFSITDAQGLATPGHWTLGANSFPPDYYLQVTTFLGLSGDPFFFHATAISGAATTLQLTGGNFQAGTVNTTLPVNYEVRVLDFTGFNGVQGVPVSWNVTGGGGSVIVIDTVTDFFGYARAQAHLGTVSGIQTIEASVGGLFGSPAIFQANGTPDAPYDLLLTAGGGQTAEVNSTVPVNPTFRVRDQYGNGVPFWWVAFSPNNGNVSWFETCTDADGYAFVSWQLGTVAGAQSVYGYAGNDPGSIGGSGCPGAGGSHLVNSPILVNATGTPGPVNNVQVSPPSAAFGALGSTRQFSAAAFDQFGNAIPSATFTWGTTNGAVAGVSPTGLVQANNVGGPVTISATFNGVPGNSSVTVTQVPRFVEVTPTSASIDSAQTQPFSAVAKDSNNNIISGASFTWTSLKSTIASVNGSGTAQALAGGQTTIRATSGTANGYATLSVSQRNYGTPIGAWVTSDTGVAVPLRDIWAADASNVFVVGSGGQVRRWNGSVWSSFAIIPGSPTLYGIWGVSPTDFWVAGSGGGIWHYDGSVTQVATIGSSHWAMWGSSPSDIFAVGSGGVIAHYNGTNWGTMSHPAGATQFYGVWGTGPDNVYVVGAGGVIMRYDGNNWNVEANGGVGTTQLHGVWGSGSDTVYVAGATFSGSGVILRRVGGVWSQMTSGTTVYLYRIWGTSSTEVYAVGDGGTVRRYNGTSWGTGQATNTTNWLWGLGGTAAGDVFTAGSGGINKRGRRGVATVTVTPGSATAGAIGSTKQFAAAAFDADGNSLSRTFTWSDVLPSIATVNASTGLATTQSNGTDTIKATPTIETWVSGKATYTVSQVTDSVVVSPVAASTGTGSVVFTGTALDSNNVAIAGKTFTWTSLKPALTSVTTPGSSTTATPVVSGQSSVRASVDGKIGHGMLTSGIANPSPIISWATSIAGGAGTIYSIHGNSFSDVYMGYANANLLKWNGVSISGVTVTGNATVLYGVWTASSGNVWAVGQVGNIWYYNGGTWAQQGMGVTTALLFGVWGTSPTDVFAVGDGGTILHYDGVSWTQMTSNTVSPLRAICGNGPTNIYAMGLNGTIVHYTGGASWTVEPGIATTGYIWNCSFTSGSTAYASVSASPYAIKLSAGTWSALPAPPTAVGLYGVHANAIADVYFTGASGTILRWNNSLWTNQSIGVGNTMYSVWGASGFDHLTGGTGAIIRRGTR